MKTVKSKYTLPIVSILLAVWLIAGIILGMFILATDLQFNSYTSNFIILSIWFSVSIVSLTVLYLQKLLIKNSYFLLITISFIVAFLTIGAVRGYLYDTARYMWDRNCREKLNELVSVESKYLEKYGKFGTFEDLLKSDYIEVELFPHNTIDNYVITILVSTPDETNLEMEHQFNIIAVPRSEKNYLRTYTINQNGNLKLWIGEKSEWDISTKEFDDPNLWKPVR